MIDIVENSETLMAYRTETFEGWPTVLLPYGLSTLLENMTRAVLTEQPEHVALFLAEYTSDLLRYRDLHPYLDLNEVINRYQSRRGKVRKIFSETADEGVQSVRKESVWSCPNLISTIQDQQRPIQAPRKKRKAKRKHLNRNEVSVTPSESLPDFEQPQKTPMVKVKHTPKPPQKPWKRFLTTLKRVGKRRKCSESNGESSDRVKDSTGLPNTSSVQEVADKSVIMQWEASLDKVKHTPKPPQKPWKRFLATLKRVGKRRKSSESDGEPSDRVKDSTGLPNTSSVEEVADKSVTMQWEAYLDKVKPQRMSPPQRRSSAASKRAAIHTKNSKSDSETTGKVKYFTELAKSSSFQDNIPMSCEVNVKSTTRPQKVSLDKDKHRASQQISNRRSSARCSSSESKDNLPSTVQSSRTSKAKTSVPSKGLSSSSLSPSSSSLSSASYSRVTSYESSSDDHRKGLASCSSKTAVPSTPRKPSRLAPKRQRSRKPFQRRPESVTETTSLKSEKEVKLPSPPSSNSRTTRKLRSTEELRLQISRHPSFEDLGTKSQRPRRSQAIKVNLASSEGEKNANESWTLYHLPHSKEEGTLSTTVLSQPQYKKGAKIRAIGPAYIALKACQTTMSPTDQDYLVIRPPSSEYEDY